MARRTDAHESKLAWGVIDGGASYGGEQDVGRHIFESNLTKANWRVVSVGVESRPKPTYGIGD